MSSSGQGGRLRRYHNTAPHNTQTAHVTPPSPSTSEPSSSSPQNNQRRALFGRDSRWAPKNRGGGKSRLAGRSRKKEEGENVECSSSSLNLDSGSCYVNGEDSRSVGGSGVGMNVGPDNGETEGCEATEESGSGNEDDALSRLKEMSFNVEPELEEQLLAVNRLLQEDELLAMESIYGEKILILENESSLKCFQVHIQVQVPQELSITTKFESFGFSEKSNEDVSDISYSFQVEYLPPILLSCLLPKSYPSKCAPHFTIYVQWLSHSKISRLCSMLDLIWAENAGQEVTYQWVEWLRNCTLSYLGFDSELLLGPYGVRHDSYCGKEERRAISGSFSSDADIPTLKRYNDEQKYENFCRDVQECSICLSEFAGSEFIMLPCQHFFCEKCLKTFTNIHVGDGTVFKIKCPEAKCDGTMHPSLIKRLLGEKEFDRWESLVLRKALDSMKDVVYCPRCEMACVKDKDEHAVCSKCYYSFCTLCMDKRHVGEACTTPELKLKMLEERRRTNSMDPNQRQIEQNILNEMLTLKAIYSYAKQCPNCKIAIARSEGCNKMVCDYCGKYFCYCCATVIEGYEHFREWGGQCKLYQDEGLKIVAGDQMAAAQMAAKYPERARYCPNSNCGQLNIKVGDDNNLRCWACHRQFCCLCGDMSTNRIPINPNLNPTQPKDGNLPQRRPQKPEAVAVKDSDMEVQSPKLWPSQQIRRNRQSFDPSTDPHPSRRHR
ncbi:NDR1/HIN1-like 8 [Striga hermonthica]|uniref:RBR-type E3 ubiquitin transferase n=1 Tax=Striga hermonthica TaxID=68872 RepID=A0A9N7RRK9_STRHE|nr:NDR1/HIN1-like 8 [Striga hermonthica]